MRADKLRRARLVERVEERFLALRRHGCQFAEQEDLAEAAAVRSASIAGSLSRVSLRPIASLTLCGIASSCVSLRCQRSPSR
jgi:hypothetical protein